MYSFKVVKEVKWDVFKNTHDDLITKSEDWYIFLKKSFGLSPYIVEIKKSDKLLGYFIGERIKRFVWIVASPFEGISTGYQGINSFQKITAEERLLIYKKMSNWLFRTKKCIYFQVSDWQLEIEDVKKYTKFKYTPIVGYRLNLEVSEDVLYSKLHYKSCKYSINKSKKKGVKVRKTSNINNFIDVYYNQLLDVFRRQGLEPTYKKERVRSLVYSLYEKNEILCLESISKEGEIIATGLFPGSANMAIYWGGASWQKEQKLCPNEPLIWEAIKYWNSKGTKTFEFGGGRSYKKKFGGEAFSKPRIEIAKYPFIILGKELAKKSYYKWRSLKSIFKKKVN